MASSLLRQIHLSRIQYAYAVYPLSLSSHPQENLTAGKSWGPHLRGSKQSVLTVPSVFGFDLCGNLVSVNVIFRISLWSGLHVGCQTEHDVEQYL